MGVGEGVGRRVAGGVCVCMCVCVCVCVCVLKTVPTNTQRNSTSFFHCFAHKTKLMKIVVIFDDDKQQQQNPPNQRPFSYV